MSPRSYPSLSAPPAVLLVGEAALAAGAARVPPRRARLEGLLVRLGRAAEVGFLLVSLLLFSQAILPLLLPQESAQALGSLQEGDNVSRNLFLALKFLAAPLILLHWRAFLRAALAHKLTLAFVALAALSVFWSAAPDVTLRRSFALATSTAVGVFLAARYRLRSLLRLVAGALGIGAVLSAVVALGLPEYGVSGPPHEGAWQGVYDNKNGLGQVMVLSAVTGLLVWKDATSHRWLPLAAAVLSTLLVLLSTSTTALFVLVTLGVLIPVYTAFRWPQTLLVAAFAFITVAGAGTLSIVLGNTATIFGAFGKDVTLTGRTGIWEALLVCIREQPWLGYGYNAFWLGWTGESARVLADIGFEVLDGHNGYLDLLVDLGGLGLGLLLAGIALAVVRAVALIRSSDGWEALWPLLFLTFVLVYSLTESFLLRPNGIFWVLYVTTACAVSGTRGVNVPTRTPPPPHRPDP